MSVTQKQIAEKLNISPSLVGRALSGHPEVAEKTRLRVAEVAKEMGYSAYANSAARALIAKRYGQKLKKGIIAVAFPHLDFGSPRHMPFFATIIEGMEAVAAESGSELYFCMLRENELPVLVREQEVDGIVFLGSSTVSVAAVEQVSKLGIPAVTVHWRCQGARSVAPDDRDGARQATRHLLELGHRRIGFLGVKDTNLKLDLNDSQTYTAEDLASLASIRRLQGYLDAMGDYGLPVQEEWIEDSLPSIVVAGAYCHGCGKCVSCSGWSTLMAQNNTRPGGSLPLTALVCHNDSVAMGAIVRAREEGYDVPGDISFVGFDHLSPDFNFHPAVTSINFPRYEMGRRAVQIIGEMATRQSPNAEEDPAWHQLFPSELMGGATTQAVAPSGHRLAETALR